MGVIGGRGDEVDLVLPRAGYRDPRVLEIPSQTGKVASAEHQGDLFLVLC